MCLLEKEKTISLLIDYGIPGKDSSMARTVGLPAAIGTRLILNGEVREKGVLVPVIPALYNPILKELKSFGVSFTAQQKSLRA